MNPSEAHRGDPGPSTTPPDDPGDTGPRVDRDEVRDLARIRRSRSDRKVAGVAGGLARHLDVDPLLLRVGFVILTFFGGGGLVLYAVCWLVVPEERTERAVIRVEPGVRNVVLIVAGVLAGASVIGDSFGGTGFPWPLLVVGIVLVAILAGKESIRVGGPTHPWLTGDGAPPPGAPGVPGAAPAPSPAGGASYPVYRPGPPPPPREPRKRGPLLFPFTLGLAALVLGVLATLDVAGLDVPAAAYPATVLGTCGLMLLVGAFYGRGGGLILVGLLAALATAATSVAVDVSAGNIDVRPTSAAAVAERYELGVGRIRIDLRDVEDLEGLDDRTLDLQLWAGEIEVIVPEQGLDVDVSTFIKGAGHVVVFDAERDDDLDGRLEGSADANAEVPTLRIDATVQFGEIRIDTEGADAR